MWVIAKGTNNCRDGECQSNVCDGYMYIYVLEYVSFVNKEVSMQIVILFLFGNTHLNDLRGNELMLVQTRSPARMDT